MLFQLKLSKADKLLSLYIREKANWTCERCHAKYTPPTKALHCSHFFGRGNHSVRWDEDNVAPLCFGCHKFMESRPFEHGKFFERRLGQKKFNALVLRAHTPTKVDQKLICVGLILDLQKLRDQKPEIIFGQRNKRKYV